MIPAVFLRNNNHRPHVKVRNVDLSTELNFESSEMLL